MVKNPELMIIPINHDLLIDYNYLNEVDDNQFKFESKFKEEFETKKELALFNLGFASKQKMSFTLKYLSNMSKYFLNQLIQIPDLDEVRSDIKLELNPDFHLITNKSIFF